MIDTIARQDISAWEQKQTGKQTIQLIMTDHGEQNTFESFGRDLADLAPSIRVKKSDGEDSLPGFILKENITYSALALDKELPPFLDGLSCI
ncbi:MAG: hypothetical protein GY860_27490, partial [Desulfobacteraceae bacterium]|nr:hypothetical protein [Desulfobacteraceae bacterium]